MLIGHRAASVALVQKFFGVGVLAHGLGFWIIEEVDFLAAKRAKVQH
jgi:hypothetical protein